MNNLQKIHIIPYSHNDYAWKTPREWHIYRYIRIYETVLDFLKQYPNATWLLDNVLHSLKPFIENCPGRTDEMKKLVKDGRIALANGGMALVRSTYTGEETFIRNLAEGKKFLEDFFEYSGIDFFYNADVACGHSQLPQLLRLCGQKYYRFERPDEALNLKGIPMQFVWEGLDTSKVVVSRGKYGGFVTGRYTNLDYQTQWDKVRAQFIMEELPQKLDLNCTSSFWLNSGADDLVPGLNLFDEPIRVPEFVEEWNKREPIEMVFSTPDKYFGDLEKEELPLYKGILDACELSYNTPIKGNLSLWRKRQSLDRLLVKAESFASMASMNGGEYPYEELKAAWLRLFELSGHGMEWALEEDYKHLFSDACAEEVHIKKLIKEALEETARLVTKESGEQYLLFNALNWDRKEVVECNLTSAYGISGFSLVDSTGAPLKWQIIETYDNEKKRQGYDFYAVKAAVEVEVPQMGYNIIRMIRNGHSLEPENRRFRNASPAKNEINSRIVVIDNGVLEVVISNGYISKIADHSQGKSILGNKSECLGNPAFVKTGESKDWISDWNRVNMDCFIPDSYGFIENGPCRWVYRIIGKMGKNDVVNEITINTGERAIHFKVSIQCHGDEGYYVATFPADNPNEVFADIPFGVESRNVSMEPYGKEESLDGGCNLLEGNNHIERGLKGLYYGKTWTCFKCKDIPAAIISGNCSIYYLHDTTANTISIFLHRTLNVKDKDSWVRNLPAAAEGRGWHDFEYSFFLFDDLKNFSEITKFAKRKQSPIEILQAYRDESDKKIISGASCGSFFKIDAPNIIVTAFYKEQGRYWIRLYETEGKTTHSVICFTIPIHTVESVDFLGNHFNSESITNTERGKVDIFIRPWEIINIRFY